MQISFPYSPRFQDFTLFFKGSLTIALILLLQNGRQVCLLAVWRRAGEETRALSLGHCVSLNKTLLACL